jgi:nucleoside 2-deoxyribosyltransferase
MKKAYLSISYANRPLLQPEIDAIALALRKYERELFIFVDLYHFNPAQEKEMMQQAFADINNADMLIAEVSDKAIGVGIEIGYAIGRGKPVIYLRNASAEHSTTAAGSAGYSIVYQNPADLANKIDPVLRHL